MHNGYYSVSKTEEILSQAAARLNLEDIMLNKISQAQEDKYYRNSFICGFFKYQKQSRKQEIQWGE